MRPCLAECCLKIFAAGGRRDWVGCLWSLRIQYGVLHGGATLALAETAGSIGAYLLYRNDDEQIRGSELSANHLRAGRVGDTLYAKAVCVNAGRTLQLWEIKVTNQEEKLISYCKFTTIRINPNT